MLRIRFDIEFDKNLNFEHLIMFCPLYVTRPCKGCKFEKFCNNLLKKLEKSLKEFNNKNK